MEEKLHINRPIVLSNLTCAYCGEVLSAEIEDTEHVVGRRFVPRGSLDGAWNLILKTCKRCNRAKADLENDISAITMQPTVAGGFHPLSDPTVEQEAARKARGSRSRHTGKPVADSHERCTRTIKSGQVTMTFSYVGPPRIAEERIVELAQFQVIGLMYWLTYDERERRGKFIEGEFLPLRPALRTDWGNIVHRCFMERVLKWEGSLVGYTAGGHFQVAIRQLDRAPCWSWALEWNRNLRSIGFLGDLTLAADLLSQMPQLPCDLSVPTLGGGASRHRREEALADADDCMFTPS